MADRLLLVHSPLVGCATWDLVAAELARAGYELDVPDLTGTVSAGPPYFLPQARVIACRTSRQPAILIGHSGAGPLLAAAGTMIGEGVRGYIFVDAGLPTPGQAWLETLPPDLATQLREMADAQGWLPPWPLWWGEEALAELLPDPAVRQPFAAGCPRLPLAMFEEIHPPAPHWPDAPTAYLQLSEAYEHEAAKARELGWPVAEVMSHHLAMLTEPGRVAGALHDLIGRLPS
jgi:pimeloyl-ACP methyl ester carboxylesterase